MADLLAVLMGLVGLVIALWWLWQGLQGTWLLIKLVYGRGLLRSSCLVGMIIVLFGWNALPTLLVILVCLGPLTLALARNLARRWAV